MDAMSSRISENLRQIRKEKKLSLDSMAEQTGVSKSMLGQIERGESSPTVATLWKIATGLHISFTALLEGRQTETQLIRKGEVSPLLSDEGRFRLFPFFPYDAERRFEMLSWSRALARNLFPMRMEQRNLYLFLKAHCG